MEEKLDLLIEAVHSLAQPTYFDWITLFISTGAVLISGLAIYFAILVPKNLANQKNRISLFEKRYELYLLLLDLYGVFYGLTKNTTPTTMGEFTQALELLKQQQGFTNNSKFYNHIITALNSPKYFFSFDITHPQYAEFHSGVETVMVALRNHDSAQAEEQVTGILENLPFFYETVKSFEHYFYICPPKKKN